MTSTLYWARRMAVVNPPSAYQFPIDHVDDFFHHLLWYKAGTLEVLRLQVKDLGNDHQLRLVNSP